MDKLTKSKNQEEFLVEAYKFYRTKVYSEVYDVCFGPDWKTVDWLYKLGRDYKVLSIDYDQFVRILTGEQKNYYHGKYHPRRSYSYRRSYSHFCDPEDYRVLKGFTYNGQDKKEKPSKNEWWEHKGIVKDRRRAARRWRSWGKSFKHFNKRKHRQLERQAIKAERYEELHQWSYKQAEDPWSWD